MNKILIERREEIRREINNIKGISEFMRDGLKGAYYDFLNRGVGYTSLLDLECNVIMYKDFSKLSFKVVLGFEERVLFCLVPTKEEINIYKVNFLK